MSRVKAVDSTGTSLTGAGLLSRTIVFMRLLEREVLAPDEKFVGLLLPPSVGAILANTALPFAHRVAVNLNYTVSSEVMNSCIRQCGIKHVLTSRRVMEKLSLKLEAKVVYLEDLIPKVTKLDKAIAGLYAYALPVPVLERVLGLTKIKDDDLLTLLFTSGSTGEPKGVMLSHRNVASNVYAIDEIVKLGDNDTALGVLPFFHSYGYTATLWTMLALPPKGVYHFSPLEPKVISEMCGKHKVTIIMATPTFLRSYVKRCNPDDFRNVDVVFASAEKLPKEICDAYEAKFGMRPSEAFGATELSPLACLNVPPSRAPKGACMAREGTVGRPIPGVEARIVDPDTYRVLPVGEPGMLEIRGPNLMLGYYKKPELTAQVIRDGWYVTGDIAFLDPDGFVQITGRQSRFSKIGGEMVPHIMIEECLQKIVADSDEEQLVAAVTAVPDDRKGERLVVLHRPLDKSPAEICRQLLNSGLPPIWIPSPDSFYEVPAIPVLGTGKLDLKQLKDLAIEKSLATASS
jgi:acyl-[acyl-carrier-protein]-phospholipid O-acyltransferase/long-chain-fatty-acid--[acyl-carrier-protein] ligase